MATQQLIRLQQINQQAAFMAVVLYRCIRQRRRRRYWIRPWIARRPHQKLVSEVWKPCFALEPPFYFVRLSEPCCLFESYRQNDFRTLTVFIVAGAVIVQWFLTPVYSLSATSCRSIADQSPTYQWSISDRSATHRRTVADRSPIGLGSIADQSAISRRSVCGQSPISCNKVARIFSQICINSVGDRSVTVRRSIGDWSATSTKPLQLVCDQNQSQPVFCACTKDDRQLNLIGDLPATLLQPI